MAWERRQGARPERTWPIAEPSGCRRGRQGADWQGKAGKSTKKGGKPGGKASGKAGKRKRDDKGDDETTPNKKKKDDVACFNCGEKGHYKNQCKVPLRITNGTADADE